MSAQPVRLDRRHLRRQETIEQVLQHAVDVMGEQGVAGLSLSEVARRMGMRTPSLYGYFDSKHAVYDALFARGWAELREMMRTLTATTDDGLEAMLLEQGALFLRWHLEHPVHAQLMSWRPAPGYAPSEEAYAVAVDVFRAGTERFAEMKRKRLLRRGISPDRALRAWTCLLSGVMTQQLANAPEESFEDGRFTSVFPDLLQMYVRHYGPT